MSSPPFRHCAYDVCPQQQYCVDAGRCLHEDDDMGCIKTLYVCAQAIVESVGMAAYLTFKALTGGD